MEKFALAVIGSGPGGYVAALRAAKLGARVALIEQELVGGTCLNWGCIPSKFLLEMAERWREIGQAREWGMTVEPTGIDWSKVQQKKNRVVEGLRRGIEFLLQKNKVTLIRGRGRLLKPHRVEVEMEKDKRIVEADNLIIATGSSPLAIPEFHLDYERIITSRQALELEQMPESILIIGGGVIGCEFATFFSSFGVQVTILEALEQILALSNLESEIVQELVRVLKRQGVTIITRAKIKELRREGEHVAAELEDGTSYNAHMALVSVGRKLNSHNLGLEESGIQKDADGGIEVDDYLRTNREGIFAIGDVTNKLQLAHLASRQAIVAVEHLLGKDPQPIDYPNVPLCIYTHPPIAAVGLSGKQAEQQGMEPLGGVFQFRALGVAHAKGKVEGRVTVIAERNSKRVLGMQIVGEQAPELIHLGEQALLQGLTVREASRLIAAHPTFSEAIVEAWENTLDINVHS